MAEDRDLCCGWSASCEKQRALQVYDPGIFLHSCRTNHNWSSKYWLCTKTPMKEGDAGLDVSQSTCLKLLC